MEEKRNVAFNYRAILLLAFFLLLFSGLFGRIVYLQVTKEAHGQDLQALAEERWTRETVLEGRRGTIFDRNGGTLAQEISSYTVYAVLDESYPNSVRDPRRTAEELGPVLDIPVDELEQRLEAGIANERFQVEFGVRAKHLSFEKKEEVETLELPGILFRKEPRRYYPKQTYASHVLGYTDRDMGNARMGLESSLNDFLVPEDGFVRYQSDRTGVRLPSPNETIQEPKHGYDVYLTLDSNIQTALEQTMTQVEEQYEPERMIAIVADPKSGEILAMSNRPSFNPNLYEQITNYTNYAVSDRFEPGSTFKVFTLAAAIEEGVYNGEDTFQSGSYQVFDRYISDHNYGRGWGEITYNEGVQRSSNVAFSKLVMEDLGREAFYEYIERFGFTEPTGIDLPNEATGLIANQYPIDAATTAIGQATAVTPIQQIQAATAVANGGKMMKPYVIDRIVNPETGTVVRETEAEVAGEPISEQTAAEVRDILETVVTSPAGTGKPYYIEGFEVAGKTGTAQIPDPEGGYLSGGNQNIFSFIGMAPKDDPQVVVYVAVDRPKLEPTEVGSAPVSNVFNSVMKHSLQYLNITPTIEEIEEKAEEGVLIEDYQGQPIASVKEELEAEGVDVTVVGTGSAVEDQMPLVGSHVFAGERVILRSDGQRWEMPDLEGWSLRDVMKFSQVMELQPNLVGSGFVVDQSIAPGSEIQIRDYLAVELRKPNEVIEESLDDEDQLPIIE
ncbi:penicillin-binding protein [Desertibacillus haloalkaliphilus]|uniref:penicillin-binding protein n=1 Tax=Desertibacillus haloalkaliphilus TaxID=1328930 RepID=UPI001C26318C|nr:PASTA domain-containing penicillin-binding protein [Desertibacillus haloalkaliphilus]MBU8907117.1 PASTA domain-containing protein [Desertibacillus haloalkaliphilus]